LAKDVAGHKLYQATSHQIILHGEGSQVLGESLRGEYQNPNGSGKGSHMAA
jgi:hypothetical protein